LLPLYGEIKIINTVVSASVPKPSGVARLN